MEENTNSVEIGQGQEHEEIPICPHCFTPYHESDHYCKKCGEAVGQFTPYIPFVNIPFNYAIFGRMWRKLWYEEGHWFGWKLIYLFMIMLLVPLMLVGLPFVIQKKFFNKSKERESSESETS